MIFVFNRRNFNCIHIYFRMEIQV